MNYLSLDGRGGAVKNRDGPRDESAAAPWRVTESWVPCLS
jgi:hypothetical protein